MGKCTFNALWLDNADYKMWLSPREDKFKAYCRCCAKEIELGKMGESALKFHMKGKIFLLLLNIVLLSKFAFA